MVIGPVIGKFADQLGKYKVFVFGSVLTIATVLTTRSWASPRSGTSR